MRKTILTLLAFAMTASTALAISVDINGTNYSSANFSTTYDFINKSSGSSDSGADKINIVDFILNGRLNSGDHKYTLVNGSTASSPTETWFANGAVNVLINEIAGYAPNNTFGYYTMGQNNAAATTELFPGSAGTNYSKSFTLSPAAMFGFYLGINGTSLNYFTEANRNPANEKHVAIFREDISNTYILGFEDLSLTTGDRDFQDMIVKVTVNPVPEPGTLVLLSAGMFGFAVWYRRRENK